MRRHPEPQGLGPEGLGLSAPILRARAQTWERKRTTAKVLQHRRWEVNGVHARHR